MVSLKSHRFRTTVTYLAVLVAISLILFGLGGFWQRQRATNNPHAYIPNDVVTHSTDNPDETPLDEKCNNYTVPSGEPRLITMPSINKTGCVQKVGIDQHGAIAVPASIYLAGWFTGSELPGQPGLSIIDGHVSGRYRSDAIFEQLGNMQHGDSFTVTLGSGEQLNYRVIKKQSVQLDQVMDVLLAKNPDVESQLNLITCGGRYDKATEQYDQRIIVSAELLLAEREEDI